MRYYLNRTLCDVLEEMRICVKTLNFSILPSLIEEAQIMGNRMEASLENIEDFGNLEIDLQAMRKEYKRLKKDIGRMEKDVPG